MAINFAPFDSNSFLIPYGHYVAFDSSLVVDLLIITEEGARNLKFSDSADIFIYL